MEKKCLYLVVPRIVEQPTWGGEYILESKNWHEKPEFIDKKIGQSYELYSGTLLRSDLVSTDDPTFTGELAFHSGYHDGEYAGDRSKLIKIDDLLKQYPRWLIGDEVIRKHGEKIKTLIKYTQAKGNSFQLHVRPEDEGKWLTKPESWYYLEPGTLTLGVHPETDWAEYESVCRQIEKELNEISRRAMAGEISVPDAKIQTKEVARKYNPWQYVNIITAKADELIDLSCCGLHHSWENGEEPDSLGNVVYELCLDVMDSVSSIRSFDKGKIKSDGSLRPIHVDDYFKYIDRSSEINNPDKHRVIRSDALKGEGYEIDSLLRCDYYSLDKFILTGKYLGKYSKTIGTYHHLFVRSGKIRLTVGDELLEVGEGHSCFIAAGTGQYMIESLSEKSEILKTFVSEF